MLVMFLWQHREEIYEVLAKDRLSHKTSSEDDRTHSYLCPYSRGSTGISPPTPLGSLSH